MPSTSKLNLNLPAGSDTIDVNSAINQQMDAIDSNFDATDCTSSTRPSAPFEGMLIYERDTGYLLCWVSSLASWKIIAKRYRGRGKVVYQESAGPSEVVPKNTESGPFLWGVFSPEPLRKYKIKWSVNFDSSDENDFGSSQLRLRYSAGATVAKTDPLIQWTWADYADNNSASSLPAQGFVVFSESATPPAQRTFGLFLQRSSNDGSLVLNSGQLHVFYIEDIGEV